VVDIREGAAIDQLPALLKRIRRQLPARLLFLEADDPVLIRRFSETAASAPFGNRQSVAESVRLERERIAPIRRAGRSDHQYQPVQRPRAAGDHPQRVPRAKVEPERVGAGDPASVIATECLPIATWCSTCAFFRIRTTSRPSRNLSGKHPSVARYIRSFPQTIEFIDRISELADLSDPTLYFAKARAYLTISFGCTGGHHRSVLIANEIRKRLGAAGVPGEGDAPGCEK